jgi:hypothetical protein
MCGASDAKKKRQKTGGKTVSQVNARDPGDTQHTGDLSLGFRGQDAVILRFWFWFCGLGFRRHPIH